METWVGGWHLIHAVACLSAACTAPRNACALYVAPLMPLTLALCVVTTCAGNPLRAEAGYSVATLVRFTALIRPPATVTDTVTLPRRLVPVPL